MPLFVFGFCQLVLGGLCHVTDQIWEVDEIISMMDAKLESEKVQGAEPRAALARVAKLFDSLRRISG
jgi:hypothetical protein